MDFVCTIILEHISIIPMPEKKVYSKMNPFSETTLCSSELWLIRRNAKQENSSHMKHGIKGMNRRVISDEILMKSALTSHIE